MSLRLSDLQVGDSLPERTHCPSNVSLFLYNAAVWNPHRIHYDESYATVAEGHSGIVIDGPLQGDWLAQTVCNWLGDDGVLLRFHYSNRQATYLGDTLTSGGRVTAVKPDQRLVELELWIRDKDGRTTSPGTATVRLTR